MLVIQSHRAARAKLQQTYPDALILDLTSRGEEPWLRFSPFYPHGDIPVPFSPGVVSASVEGIWQGLKVFEGADIDLAKLRITTMKNLKRTVRTHGKVLGHRKGVNGSELLGYLEARKLIYLPTYRWVLEHCVQAQLVELEGLARERTVILLDYETNTDINATGKPLSHAGLVKLYLERQWPVVGDDE